MKLKDYAARRGVSMQAVSKAVAAGRLGRSVERDEHGRPRIADPELADREWTAATRQPAVVPSSRRGTQDESGGGISSKSIARVIPAPDTTAPDYQRSRALKEAALARKESANAELAEIDVAERRGELVPVDEARAEMVTRITAARNRLLGVPSRLAQRMPDLAARVVPVAEEAIREVLEDLARGVEA